MANRDATKPMTMPCGQCCDHYLSILTLEMANYINESGFFKSCTLMLSNVFGYFSNGFFAHFMP
jgi:hypothetical protein